MSKETTLAKDLLLGKTANNEKIVIDVVLRELSGKRQTTDHKEANGGTELSIMGTVYDSKVSVETLRAGTASLNHLDKATVSGGQIYGDLKNIVEPFGVSSRDVARLQEIWEKYHLNAVKAGCIHQQKLPEGKDGSWGLDNIAPCPETGYRWGSAWLYEALPSGLVSELQGILSKVTK